MNKVLIVILFCLLVVTGRINGQKETTELNARVTINSDRLEGTNRDVYTSLQNALTRFVNEQKWSTAKFFPIEKIECSFSIVLMTHPTDNTYTAEISVQARRPVYNSTYVTTLLNFRDTNLDFEYMENSPVEFVENSITNNLVATMAYYCYLIMALDFDSFASGGGSYFYRQAQSITMQAQGNPSWGGWKAFESSTNRHAVITALMDESLIGFRDLWYTYHRKGLDEMTANPDRARTTIIEALPVLKTMKQVRSSAVLLQMFFDTKLDEVVAICSKATAEEKKEVYDLLYSLFPSAAHRLEPLKK